MGMGMGMEEEEEALRMGTLRKCRSCVLKYHPPHKISNIWHQITSALI